MVVKLDGLTESRYCRGQKQKQRVLCTIRCECEYVIRSWTGVIRVRFSLLLDATGESAGHENMRARQSGPDDDLHSGSSHVDSVCVFDRICRSS